MAKKDVPKKTAKETVSTANAEEKLSHQQFREAGVLSLFLGRFETEEELDTYLSETFPVDFGFVIDDRDAPEMSVSPNRSCPIGEILSGFSWSEEFAEPVTKALAKASWHRTSAAVVFYNFSYDPKAYRLYNAFGKLKFMGRFLVKQKTWIPLGGSF